MVDAHVRLGKGDFSVEWIEQSIEYAVKRISPEHEIDIAQMKQICTYVPILTSSDAHSPQNVGLYTKEMSDLIQSV